MILEREEERERQTDMDVEGDRLRPVHTLTGDPTQNLGMCPDQESNTEPFFGVWDDAPTN